MKPLKSIAAASVVLMLGATSSLAGQCGYEYCWGAVGSAANGAYGWAHSYPTEQQAYDAVQSSCEGECTEIKTFYNTCGAMARSPSGAWGWAWDNTRERAENSAIGYCLQHGDNCRVVVWACSP